MTGAEFRLLGPVEVWVGGQPVDCGPAKQRRVLAVLLWEAGRVVSTATLVDRVWGASPPEGALAALYAYVARLRKVLSPQGIRLIRRTGGYLLDVDAEDVDVHRFQRLGRGAGVAELDAALALWRGRPLAGQPAGNGDWAGAVRETLVEQRLRVVLERGEGYLKDGRHAELVASLRELTAEYPCDEQLVAQLMTALYRCGRGGDALDEYRMARQRLADRQGSEPGPQLRRLHQRILRDDPALEHRSPGLPAEQPVPAGLPPAVPDFVGRRAEVAALDTAAASGANRRTATIFAIDGGAGVGKTALAVHWAHRVAGRYPEGSLFADLHGHGPVRPAEPARVLDNFLAALAVPASRVPVDVDAKTALYRALMRDRRMLVLLDNAADPRQVRPLLPAAPGCLVLVTSRHRLAGLAVRERAARLSLDVLPMDDAVTLLTGFVGAERIEAEPAAARELAHWCSRLPVALCVAGERAAVTGTALSNLARGLADGRRRLDLLDAGGDRETEVRAVFSWSYDLLPPRAARVFRLLGLAPGASIARDAAAALAGIGETEADRMLDALAAAHLVEPAGEGRYRMHDLLRAYAAEKATHHDAERARQAALTRLLDHYLAVTAANPGPAWWAAERAELVAAVRYAYEQGRPLHAVRLAPAVGRVCLRTGHPADAIAVHTSELRAARAIGDLSAQAHALTCLGNIDRRRGELDLSARQHRAALDLYRKAGDRRGEAGTLTNLGLVHYRLGDYDLAASTHGRALILFEFLRDTGGRARALGNLGIAAERQGRYRLAVRYQRRALAMFRATGARQQIGAALANLGILDVRLGRWAQAEAHTAEALAIAREVGDRSGEAHALSNFGLLYQRLGRQRAAADHYRWAADLFRELGEAPPPADHQFRRTPSMSSQVTATQPLPDGS